MNKNNCFANANACSGCGACYSVCPVSAISYMLSADGFFQAYVDEKKCISCGKCVKVCPKYLQNTNPLAKNTFSVYSFIHKDPVVLANSSSGASAWALTELAATQGYQAVGVEYNYQTNTAQATLAETLQQAEKFKGSKYVQADTRFYKELLQKNGKFIVFGTPCQIAGLSKALEQTGRRKDFLLVDCFCHGVPSYLMWHSFLKHIGIEHPKNVSFRSKKGGWHNYLMDIKGDDKSYRANVRTNEFYALFFNSLLLNDSCYDCGIKSCAYSDIRIGDFWGSACDLNETGVSLIIPISQNGKAWVAQLAGYGSLRELNALRPKITKIQSAFSGKKSISEKRRKLLTCLATQSFEQAFKIYQAGAPGYKKISNLVKFLCPRPIAKYVRFFAHKLKGC